MTVVLAWLRLDLRRRWRSLAALALLIAVASGTVMTALAGARRGASAIDRTLARTLPSTAAILPNTPGFDWDKIRALPEVETLATFGAAFTIQGLPADVAAEPVHAPMMSTIEKPVVYAGRVFDQTRDDEVVVTRQFVAHFHKSVGDTVVLDLPTPKQLADQIDGSTGSGFAGPHLRMHIVGVISSPWFSDSPGSTGGIVMSPGVVAHHPANTLGDQSDPNNNSFVNALVRLRGGEAAIPRLRADVTRITGRADIDIWDLPEQFGEAQRQIAFEARCLVAFAIAAFVAALFLVGQAIARYAAASTAELQTMRALGMTPRQAIVTAAAGPAMVGVLGACLGVASAFVASRWLPIGTASLLEPSPGYSFDWVVFGPGILTIAALVAVGAAASAWLALGAARRDLSSRRSAVATAVARAGFSASRSWVGLVLRWSPDGAAGR